MTDEFVVNFDDVEDTEFDNTPVPPGWYRVMVDSYSEEYGNGNEIVIKRKDGKLPEGTKGTSWAFKIVDDDKHDGRMIWATYWHHGKTVGFWKTLYKASGVFVDGELAEDMDLLNERERVVGAEMWAQLKVTKSKDYEPKNDIRTLKHLDERKAKAAASTGLMP